MVYTHHALPASSEPCPRHRVAPRLSQAAAMEPRSAHHGRSDHGRSDRGRAGQRSPHGRSDHGRSDRGRADQPHGRSDQGRGKGKGPRYPRREFASDAEWIPEVDGERPQVDCQGVHVLMDKCGRGGVGAPTLLTIPRRCRLPGALFISNLDAVASTEWLQAVAPTMVVTAAGDQGLIYNRHTQMELVTNAIASISRGGRPEHIQRVFARCSEQE